MYQMFNTCIIPFVHIEYMKKIVLFSRSKLTPLINLQTKHLMEEEILGFVCLVKSFLLYFSKNKILVLIH